ncbi:hypothetical protein Ahy_A08g040581 [Arachis hypogaea]|uniref:HMA domain-containing protein n=1 Tax=Arachis hypogaea TaxID=3818 RepID=A0A445C0B3_ARAHY|nr:hypothetical protein Ahy_A08g040581 [Arachis hypogaea]
MSIDIVRISDVMCDAGKSCGVESVCLYGGTSKGPQISSLKSGIVTVMKLKVDLECHKCYKKVKKVLAKFPQYKEEGIVSLENLKTFTFRELQQATDSFSSKNILGAGGAQQDDAYRNKEKNMSRKRKRKHIDHRDN